MSFLGLGSKEPEVPIYPPSNPEYAGMYAAWEQEDMTGTVGVALDNSSLIISIESFLSGRELVSYRDEKTGKMITKWQQTSTPKMNEKGVRAIVLEVRSQLDKNTIMTYFPDLDLLHSFMMHFGEDLYLFLGQNMDEFEMTGTNAHQVGSFIIRQVYITLLRGLEGNEKQGVYKQNKRIENYTIPINSPQAMQRKGGLL